METKKISPEMMKRAGELLKNEHSRRVELEKQASAAEKEKKAQAVAFREVELGLSEPFKTYDEFQEKVASLMEEDLEIVEKALDRGYHGVQKTAGELAGNGDNGAFKDPLSQYVLTGEL